MIDWQMVATLVIVAAAAIYLVRMNYRRWRSNSAGCAGDCCSGGSRQGSTSTSQLISPESLLSRLEKKR